MLKTIDLKKNYGELEVLKGISTEIKKGEVVSLIGPSGSGKSTFLRCLNYTEIPGFGEVYFKGQKLSEKEGKDFDINKVRASMGMVFQHFNLFANKNVLQNLTLAPIKAGILDKQNAEKRADELLKSVGLSDKKYTFPHKLSGGQKQRIAIARSLAMNPEVILFDEPTSALDPEMIGEVLDIMKDVAAKGITMLVVTHEMGFAKNVANRIFFMHGGKIAVDDTPKNVFENPGYQRLQDFLGKILNH